MAIAQSFQTLPGSLGLGFPSPSKIDPLINAQLNHDCTFPEQTPNKSVNSTRANFSSFPIIKLRFYPTGKPNVLQQQNPFITHDSRKTAESTQPDQRFRSVAQATRIIHEYSGILPCARHGTRHILRCEHLRQLPSERFPPYRADPSHTHQLWLWYKRDAEPDKLILIFRGQFDAKVTDQNADAIALNITHFIAEYLMANQDEQRITRQPDSDLFWASLIEHRLTDLKGKRIKDTESILL